MRLKDAMTLKYIGFYDDATNARESREYALSATSKMDYISEVMNRIGYRVSIVSPSQTRHRRAFPSHTRRISSTISLTLLKAHSGGSLARRIIRQARWRLDLLIYLLKNTRKGEPVVVYHSLAIQEVLITAMALRRFRLVLEVEEIYQDVVKTTRLKRWFEYKLFRMADAFVFSTGLLEERVNLQSAPMAVVHGNYTSSTLEREKWGDGRTHVVYAGTLDPRKGASAAAAAAEFLDDTYHVHILGSGSDEEIAAIKNLVLRMREARGARISYDGVLQGEKYSKFLSYCDIGLSPQDPSARFTDTSFPSKILSYLRHGLSVVSVRIPAVETSPLASVTTFYDGSHPKTIADAIKVASERVGNDAPSTLHELDTAFAHDLSRLIKNLPRP